MKASQMYQLSLQECADTIRTIGNKRTVLMRGHMGIGKSSTLNMLAQDMPNHLPCYFDCTTKDLGDITIPNIKHMKDGSGFVRYLTNEELGVHNNRPIILMLDELGKANTAVKLAVMRICLDRKIGSYKLHPDSIVYATSNLGAEGVGDMFQGHQLDRMVTINVRKPDNMEFIEYGVVNGFDPTLLAFCKDNSQLFHGFEDYDDPEENPYIYHPRATRSAFCTPRSLHCASDILKARIKHPEIYSDKVLTAALMGAIGERTAMDMMAFVSLADQLPTLESIKQDPQTAKVPTNASALCMVVYRSLVQIDKNWLNSWMEYIVRLPSESQAMFANGVRAKNYSKRPMVMTNKKFTEWARLNNYMFSADKK